MHAEQRGTMPRCQFERRILHTDWSEEPLREIRAEPLSAHSLNGLTDPVDIDAVIPFFAGIEGQRQRKRRILAGDDVRSASLFDVTGNTRIPYPIDKPGGVGDQLPQGNRSLRRT